MFRENKNYTRFISLVGRFDVFTIFQPQKHASFGVAWEKLEYWSLVCRYAMAVDKFVNMPKTCVKNHFRCLEFYFSDIITSSEGIKDIFKYLNMTWGILKIWYRWKYKTVQSLAFESLRIIQNNCNSVERSLVQWNSENADVFCLLTTIFSLFILLDSFCIDIISVSTFQVKRLKTDYTLFFYIKNDLKNFFLQSFLRCRDRFVVTPV